jgi:hypothetical protein
VYPLREGISYEDEIGVYAREAFRLHTLMLDTEVFLLSQRARATGELAVALGFPPSTFYEEGIVSDVLAIPTNQHTCTALQTGINTATWN